MPSSQRHPRQRYGSTFCVKSQCCSRGLLEDVTGWGGGGGGGKTQGFFFYFLMLTTAILAICSGFGQVVFFEYCLITVFVR